MEAMDVRSALEIVSPWIGAGGLTAILVAFFSWRAQRGAARPGNTFAALYADHEQMQDLVRAVVRQTEAVEKLAGAAERSVEVADRVAQTTRLAADGTEQLCKTIQRATSDFSEAIDHHRNTLMRIARTREDNRPLGDAP